MRYIHVNQKYLKILMKGFNMNIWNYHDTKMQELKQLYNKISKRTQNRLQEIFDTFNLTTENIYNIANNKTKKRINTYIERLERTRTIKK